ncbi:glutaredoxin-like protein C5orf63 homolog isoform X5 [Scyliorhinus canicula]|uniref:glutaredoxin-like protein C5orf63 homolog isoform X5 n=1 Tax=Scyliorhinus canicula TaxID=7830 RepID=UPI0018F47C1F|nr:glutaredoxin-like protein C5orf63 homolog isoform X5 [Scyliorhinus canicula]
MQSGHNTVRSLVSLATGTMYLLHYLNLGQSSKSVLELLLRRMSTHSKDLPVLTLFTKFMLQEVDITVPENSVWYERYKYDIPVFHLNGQFLMMHKVNFKILEKRLTKLEEELNQSS